MRQGIENRRRFGCLVTATLLVALSGACSGGKSSASKTPSNVGGIGHETLAPNQLSSGAYETNVFSDEESELAMLAEENEGSPYAGTISGIEVDPHFQQDCDVDWTKMTATEVATLAVPLPISLPPGAYEILAPSGWRCITAPLFVNRHLEFKPYDVFVGITRRYDCSTLRASAGASRVSAGTIQGRPAVFIEPITEAGAGNSYIAFKDGSDLIEFGGGDIRFDDLKLMANSFPL